METFQWNTCFITGLNSVDEQHYRIVDLINRFGVLTMRQDGASLAEIEAVFNELAEYATFHFADEETLMDTLRVDPRHVAQHRADHASFLDDVT